MQQLSPLDTVVLVQGTPNAPSQMGPIFLCDQSSAPGGRITFKGILAGVEERLHLAPAFRRKLVTVPFGLDRAWWVEDENFDLEFHVRHLALPRPGDWRQFNIQIARLMARPLDLSRPPWELYVIEGLDDVPGLPEGAFALFFKVHHSAIDGQEGLQLFSALAGLTPDEKPTRPLRPWRGERTPTAAELVARSALSLPRRPVVGARMVAGAATKAPKIVYDLVRSRGRSLGIPPPTRFSGQVGPHRAFEGVRFELDEVRRVKRAVDGATVNDVALTVVAGGLRRYLLAHEELPDAPLIAAVPVSTRTTGPSGEGGNQIDGARVPIATDIADDVERLRVIAASTRDIRTMRSAVSYESLATLCELMPGALMGLGLRAGTGLAAKAGRSIAVNTTVTNVAGLRVPIYLLGGRLLSTYGTAPIVDGIGLTHVVMSYCDELTISVMACREMLPDPAFYADCLRESFQSLAKQL